MMLPVSISEVLDQLAENCPGLQGAVVATHDGLLLAATPSFSGDTPAACAASLSVHLETDLSLIQQTGLSEALVWAPPGIWYLARLAHNHLLLAYSSDPDQAGALRLSGQIAAQQIGPMLLSGG